MLQFADIINLLQIHSISIINIILNNNIFGPYGKEGFSSSNNNNKLLPIILLVASAVAIVAMSILPFFGVYFFFLFLPLAFSLPWSLKRLRRHKARKHWNVEDLR